MTDEDYQRINNFRPPHYNPPSVHWDKLSADEDIVSLVNEFDKHTIT